MTDAAFLRCIQPDCAATYDLAADEPVCSACGALLDVVYDWNQFAVPGSMHFFATRWATRNERLDFSGVWRFRELLPFAAPEELVTIGEGQTLLQTPDVAALNLRIEPGRLHLQYEGLNPSGSFKDNGMAAAFTMARKLGRHRVACASTGNTSASMALYAALNRLQDDRPLRAIVFIGDGKIAYGKLAQALDHGALTLQIDGDFDACMSRVREAAGRLGLYVMNSVNPFRLEGQKTIMYRVLEGLGWEVPDWIVVPGGNLGNTSAFGKAFTELRELGLVEKTPRLAVVNAVGANTFCELVDRRGVRWDEGKWNRAAVDAYYAECKRQTVAKDAETAIARTVASAIDITRPVNLPRALRALEALDGVLCEVTDEEILDEKARLGRGGLGCEPASAASLAGLRQLLARGVVGADQRVVCILTGHALKDPEATVAYHIGSQPTRMASSNKRSEPASQHGREANRPIRVPDDLDAICRVIESHS